MTQSLTRQELCSSNVQISTSFNQDIQNTIIDRPTLEKLCPTKADFIIKPLKFKVLETEATVKTEWPNLDGD